MQNLLGTSTKVRQAQQAAGKAQANQLSVALELQADCYAGVWGHYVDRQLNLLEAGDIEEGIAAASAVGMIACKTRRARRAAEAFTHGSSADRVKWFKTGFASGKLASCNTFNRN